MRKTATGTQKKKKAQNPIEQLDRQLLDQRNKLAALRKTNCYLLLLGDATIGPRLVDDVFDDLSKNYAGCENLDIILDSSGGDINAAYNLAQLLRRYGPN